MIISFWWSLARPFITILTVLTWILLIHINDLPATESVRNPKKLYFLIFLVPCRLHWQVTFNICPSPPFLTLLLDYNCRSFFKQHFLFYFEIQCLWMVAFGIWVHQCCVMYGRLRRSYVVVSLIFEWSWMNFFQVTVKRLPVWLSSGSEVRTEAMNWVQWFVQVFCFVVYSFKLSLSLLG